MKKFLGFIVVLLLLVGVGGYFSGRYLLTKYTRELIPSVTAVSRQSGVDIQDLAFEYAAPSSLKEISWYGVSAKGKLSGDGPLPTAAPFSIHAKALRLGTTDFNATVAAIRAEGVTVETSGSPDVQALAGREATSADTSIDAAALTVDYFEYPLPISVPSIRSLNKQFVMQIFAGASSDLEKFLNTGVGPEDRIDMRGDIKIVLRGAEHHIGVRTVRKGSESGIQLDPESLKNLTEAFNTRITEPEADIIATNPLKAPRLLALKYKAEQKADESFGDDQGQHDAYKYVYWSYVLTKAFGAEFAGKVTTAHETDVPGQPEAERAMDMHNGVIGREYAARNIREDQLLATFRKDSRVQRRAK